MGDADAWDWVCPPADWTDIPDWDLHGSVHREVVRADERQQFLCSLPYGEALAYQDSLRRLDWGLQSARREWATLSDMQRDGLAFEHAGLRRKLSDATRRSLVRRELMDDMGLTEKGRFVLLEGVS